MVKQVAFQNLVDYALVENKAVADVADVALEEMTVGVGVELVESIVGVGVGVELVERIVGVGAVVDVGVELVESMVVVDADYA